MFQIVRPLRNADVGRVSLEMDMFSHTVFDVDRTTQHIS